MVSALSTLWHNICFQDLFLWADNNWNTFIYGGAISIAVIQSLLDPGTLPGKIPLNLKPFPGFAQTNLHFLIEQG